MPRGLHYAPSRRLSDLSAANARGPITGITLIAGFASTVGWPVTALLTEHFGWRASCFAWADRKSTRLNSSHSQISYAVFCLKKKKEVPKLTRAQPSYHP